MKKTTIKVERVYHPWDKWECFKAGFFTPPKGKEQKEKDRVNYARLLSDLDWFGRTMDKIMAEWPYSCEHNLTNDQMNRIAWLGQASGAYEFGCCAEHTAGAFYTLTQEQQDAACDLAAEYLERWLKERQEKINERTQAVS